MTRARTDKTKSKRREVGVEEVVSLKHALAKVADALRQVEAVKQDLEKQLERARSNFDGAKIGDDPNRQYPALADRSIIDTIADHFEKHRGVSFSPADVMQLLRIPNGHIHAVRVSLKRLEARGVLKHDRYGVYRWNTEHEET